MATLSRNTALGDSANLGNATLNYSSLTENNVRNANNDGGHYVYWLGEDGNIWVNKNGNTYSIGKPVGNSLNSGYAEGTNMSMRGKGTLIDNPNPSSSSESSTSYTPSTASTGSSYDYLKAARASEAQNIKDSMLGYRDKVSTMLNDILKNIDTVYSEEKSKRDEQKDKDSAELLNQLAQALPEIASSFAAIGAYDSSWNNDAQGETKEEHNKAQDELQTEYESDMTTLGNKRNQARTDATTAKQNFDIDFDTFNDTEANSDNLETLRASKNSLLKAVNDFNSQGDYYKPGSTLQQEMSGLGSYDGQKAIDAFGSFLTTAGAGGSGVKAGNETTSTVAAKTKNKNEKSELEQNKATGVAK